MTVWKCSADHCDKDAEVIAVGTTLCKEHGGQVAGLLNALMMVTYQKETTLGLEEQERKEMQRIEEEEKRKAQSGERQQVQ
jgi:hypothetical protein